MKDLKIILLCSSRFALPAIKELAFYRMLSIVAIPAYCDEIIENVETILQGTNIPVLKLDKNTFAAEIAGAIRTNEINLGLVLTFPFKIPSSVFDSVLLGFYNLHPGPLPQYRGADPVFRQLVNQEKQAGVTLHKIDVGIDTGPLVIIEMLKIDPTDTYGWLTTKLANLAAKLTGNLIKLLNMELNIALKPQDETKARYYKRQQAADIVVNWQTMNADAVIALIHACNPWNKGAVTKINNQVIRLLDAVKLAENKDSIQEPGNIRTIGNEGICVSTLNGGAILIRMVYCDEGFLLANDLIKLGIMPGNRFEGF